MSDLHERLSKRGQEHLLTFWDDLSDNERNNLTEQLNSIDLANVQEVFEKFGSENSAEALVNSSESLIPIAKENTGTASCTDSAEKYFKEGLRAISQSKVGAIILAGGQGTRLGVSYPKGCYNVGLPSQKSLFELQIERIRKLQALAKDAFPGTLPKIHCYLMTSEATHAPTLAFFQEHSFFGLEVSQFFFFKQSLFPCLTLDGKLILDSKDKVALAPGGNGGLYSAIGNSGALEHMRKEGVEHLHVYCVDNVLVKPADPSFIGFCLGMQADCGAKVVEKTDPKEPVGVVCHVANRGPQVVEYSELPESLAEERESGDGSRLRFHAGNIANHFFTREFLERIYKQEEQKMVFHVAKKKIPFLDLKTGQLVKPVSPNGIKMEKFVFDVFPFAQKFVLWEVVREEEFSPLKNDNSAKKDCPDTCRLDLSRLHKSYMQKAGAKFDIEGLQDPAWKKCAMVKHSANFLFTCRIEPLNKPLSSLI